ncbi:sphinganine kinase lcb4 [Umbelopsis sp. WA50703]
MLRISALIPDNPAEDESSVKLYKLAYSVDADAVKEAKEFSYAIMNEVYKDVAQGKRIKVLINPFGGQGKAKNIYERQVKPVFEAAKCVMDVQYTERQGHAIDIAKEIDIEKFDSIVTVSGDGVIHEVINGFLQRSDAREAIKKLPLGVIPGGTGNALSISLLGETAGFDAQYTALQVIKGKPMTFDLCSVTYDDHRYFSFLSQNYGITAYADLGTEHMRWMGDARTIVGLLQQIFGRHTYSMEASFDVIESDKSKIAADYQTSYDRSEDPKVVNENEPSGEVVDSIPPLSEPVPENWTTVNGDISVFLTSKVPWLARGMLSHPYCMPNDGLLDLMLIRNGAGIGQQLDVFTKLEKGKHISSDIIEYYKVKAFRLTPVSKPSEKKNYVAIDGEHSPVKPFQVEVHPCLGAVLSLEGRYRPTTN